MSRYLNPGMANARRSRQAPRMRAEAAHAWRWGALTTSTLFLHYAWEVLQGPLYRDYAGKALAEHALPCLVSAFGDMLIAAVAYTFAASLTHRWRWPFEQRRTLPATLCLAAGLTVTVLLEFWAVSAGRWSYAPEMPLILGVGLSPLLQWTVIPTLTFLLLPRRWRHPSQYGARLGEAGPRTRASRRQQ